MDAKEKMKLICSLYNYKLHFVKCTYYYSLSEIYQYHFVFINRDFKVTPVNTFGFLKWLFGKANRKHVASSFEVENVLQSKLTRMYLQDRVYHWGKVGRLYNLTRSQGNVSSSNALSIQTCKQILHRGHVHLSAGTYIHIHPHTNPGSWFIYLLKSFCKAKFAI